MKKVFIGLALVAVIATIAVKIQPQDIITKIYHIYLLNRLPKQLEKWRNIRAKEAQKPSKKLHDQLLKLAKKIHDNYYTIRRIEKKYPQRKGLQKVERQYGKEINSIKNIIQRIYGG